MFHFSKEKLVPESGWREKVYRIIYFSDSSVGKLFDTILLLAILISTGMVMLESVPSVQREYGRFFLYFEWTLGLFFIAEYYLRIASIKNYKSFMFSAFGVIDLLTIISFFISLVFPQMHFLVAIRMLRLLRIFRIFRLIPYLKEASYILKALQDSYRKIIIFLLFITIVSIIVGSAMYVLENKHNEGFKSIPQSIYWAIVTITTVGYGDVAPSTAFGKFISVILMLCGYGIIAVPTGIVVKNLELLKKAKSLCKNCGNPDNDIDAKFCKRCGELVTKK
ncbi:MAG TPA: ion transporter [Chitinophagaceae bacterium]|nr:MAG: ion transporter [Bacteroidetes bacterium OLB11]HMN32196.1 ion transporter [Chitinophagaceae bacterium]